MTKCNNPTSYSCKHGKRCCKDCPDALGWGCPMVCPIMEQCEYSECIKEEMEDDRK